MPSLELYDHQSSLPLDMTRLFRVADAALQLVLEVPAAGGDALPELEEIEISFLDDETIARVHEDFMGDPAPTDVITFDHGEILISTDTAVRQAEEGNHSPEREVALYIVHGLLHLHGYSDKTPEGFTTMKQLQEAILEKAWPAAGDSPAPSAGGAA